jgi:hypothetical protein
MVNVVPLWDRAVVMLPDIAMQKGAPPKVSPESGVDLAVK